MPSMRAGLSLASLICALWCMQGSARADGPGLELHSALQGAQLVTTLSSEGAVTTLAPKAGSGGPSITAAVRYQDRTAWVADMNARSVVQGSLADRLAHRREEAAQVAAQHWPVKDDKRA